MKTQISRDSFHPNQRYSGVYLQQGRMILDADWNELTDIQKARLIEALRDAIGGGAPREGGLSLQTLAGHIKITPGMVFAEGVPAKFETTDGQPVAILAQTNYPLPKAVCDAYVETNLRFYADIWERSITALQDGDLLDAGLHGADTATRSQPLVQVKWCTKSQNPLTTTATLTTTAANPAMGSATLNLALRSIASDGDACDPCASQVSVNERIGNYLFRVEVHDYQNNWLTLKWSRDNGAEACAASAIPTGFKQGDWVWEFFDNDSERLLGNHLTRNQDWAAEYYAAGDVLANAFLDNPSKIRGILRESAELPASVKADGTTLPDGSVPKRYLRQWDGYLRINLASKALHGLDRGVALFMGAATDDNQAKQKHGRVFIDNSLHINLERMMLSLAIEHRHFVAGDYWLARVREAVDESGDEVLIDALPSGIQHHYLYLGEQDGSSLKFGELDDNGVRRADSEDAYQRRMHFPPLSDLKARDIGFTEQCHNLFEGAQNVQDALDNICHISAEDIAFTNGCESGDLFEGASNVQDALDSLCQLGADDVRYDLPDCDSDNTVKSLLSESLPVDDSGNLKLDTALDVLFCQLNADSLPYTVPDCMTDMNVCGKLGLKVGDHTQVGPVLDKLLCEFDATDLPLDKSDADLCPSLLADDVVSVQDALDLICKTPPACAITVAVGQLEEILRRFLDNDKQTNLWLCLQPGEHVINGPLDILGKASLRLAGLSASGSRIRLSNAPTVLEAGELLFENLGWVIDATARLTLRGQRISSERCSYSRTATSSKLPPMLLLQTWDQGLKLFNITPELFWRDNTLRDTWLNYAPTGGAVFTSANIGDIAIANRFSDLFGDPLTLIDSTAFNTKVKDLAKEIAVMPADKITNWSNRLAVNPSTGITVPTVTPLRLLRVPASEMVPAVRMKTSPANYIGRTQITAPSADIAQPQIAIKVNEIVAATGNIDVISGLLIDMIIGYVVNSGFGVALALADNQLSGSLCDNHIEGEVELKNGLANNGFDPSDSGLNNNSHPGITANGDLILSGNRLERLWAHLPTGSINADGTWAIKSPGYHSLTLSGNEFNGLGHSFVASMVTLQGNRFLCGPVTAKKSIARLFTESIAISCNVADFNNALAPIQVAANSMAPAANLVVVTQV